MKKTFLLLIGVKKHLLKSFEEVHKNANNAQKIFWRHSTSINIKDITCAQEQAKWFLIQLQLEIKEKHRDVHGSIRTSHSIDRILFFFISKSNLHNTGDG